MRLARVALLALLVASCGSVSPTNPPHSPTPPTTRTGSPSLPPTLSAPAIVCEGIVDADCGPAADATLHAVRSHGVPSRIELGSGTTCPREGQTCPYPVPPENGRWVGHAIVLFRDSPQVARLNVSEAGGEYRAVLVAYLGGESVTP